eukprot:COSAG01_NODE_629_length_14689_cov_298.955517_3_plen_153_part_00
MFWSWHDKHDAPRPPGVALGRFSDETLLELLLQLVQALKYEPYHDNPISRFMLARALRSRVFASALFWALRAEHASPLLSEKFGLLLEELVRCLSPRHFEQLRVTTTVRPSPVLGPCIHRGLPASEDDGVCQELMEEIPLHLPMFGDPVISM